MVAIPQRPRAPQASEQAPDCTTYEAEHALVVHMGTSFSDTAPERHVLSLDAFLAQLVQAPRVGAKDGSFFQTIEYEPGARRDKEHILHALTYVADIDRGDLSEQDIRDTFDGWRAAAYTTWSSGPLATDDEAAACADCRRSSDGRCKTHNGRNWRVVVPFSHAASAPLFEAVHDHHFVPLLGDDLGDESRKIAQIWYFPAVPAGREADHIAFQLEGEMFDPREYLELAQPRGNGADAATAPKDCNHRVIQAWNAAHTLPALLEAHGYEFVRKGAKAEQWRHPGSTSGSAAAWLYHDDGKLFAHSAGDSLRPTSVESNRKAGKRDSFDAMRILDCGGDWAAAFRHAEKVLGIEPADAPSSAGENQDPFSFEAVCIDAGELAGHPKPQAWAWQPWVPAGVVTGLAGPAGVAKSTLALQLCIHKALGIPLFGDGIEQGNAVFATTEDDVDELHRRVHRICAAMKVPVDSLKRKLTLLPLAAEAPMLVTVDRDGRVLPTEALSEFEMLLKAKQARLVVLDLLNDYWPGSENIRAEVTPFIRKHLGGMASRLKCGLVGLSHPSVAAVRDGRIFAGSTAVVGSVRSGISMVRDQLNDNLIHLTVEKANYAKKGQTASVRWTDGYLRQVSATEKADQQKARERALCEIVLDVLRARAGDWLSRDEVWRALGSETKQEHGDAARNREWTGKRLFTLTHAKTIAQREGKSDSRKPRLEWSFKGSG